MTFRTILTACIMVIIVGIVDADPPSGLKPGDRPMPYSFIVATGPQRGQTFCYICDTSDKPAVIVFTRSLSDPLGKLAAKIDQAVADAAIPELRSWMTMVTAGSQPGSETKLVEWSRKHALRQMPLGVFEDEVGPPAYRLNSQTDINVILFVQQKVVASFAFKANELNDDRVAEIITSLEKLK